MGGAVSERCRDGGRCRGAGEQVRSAAGASHVRYFRGLLAEGGEGPIADGLNAARKYVATHRPASLGWGPVEDLSVDVVEGVRKVKAKEGPDVIVWGSSTLTSVLLDEGLIDEVVLLVYPVLLGRGKRFFSESSDARELAFVSTKAMSSGVLVNVYRYVGALRTE
jgi:dihydrofolate reductase